MAKKPKALVVDDERVIADSLATILNQAGFDASAVYTGTSAVEESRKSKPDLVISDVIMPDMKGRKRGEGRKRTEKNEKKRERERQKIKKFKSSEINKTSS